MSDEPARSTALGLMEVARAACVASEETYAHLRRDMLDAPANPAG